ncbi:MAG TPA: hypothetical protein VHF02_10350 [Luteimonas sp.]|nr:hypothetical protein [Luteimonas sp.]
MNRKLQRSTLALSATTAVLAMLLLAGAPTLPPPASTAPLLITLDSASNAAGSDADPAADGDVVRLNQRRHVRRSRAVLALPYFSFAQGLRRVTGS